MDCWKWVPDLGADDRQKIDETLGLMKAMWAECWIVSVLLCRA